MTHKTKTSRFFMVLTTLLGLNLLILGKVMALNQVLSLDIQSGNLTVAVPSSISFGRTVVNPNITNSTTAVLDPRNNSQNILVLDAWTGNQFHLNVSLQNLTNTTGSIVQYTDFSVLTLHGNSASEAVDTNANNTPPGLNNVTSQLSYFYDQNTSNPVNFPDVNFTAFPVDAADPDPTDAGSVSLPVTIMERNTTTPSAGIYSEGLALRANIPGDTLAGNFSGELTFSLEP